MKFLKYALVAVFLFVAAVFVCAIWAWDELNAPIVVDTKKLVQIPRGVSSEQAMVALDAAGMIRHKLSLRVYIKLTGAGPRIKAGDYYFPSPISPLAVLQKLEEGGQSANKLTVVEGWNRWDIADAMVAIPSLHLAQSDDALKLMYDVSLIKDLDPGAKSLEGYLFPETYYVYTATSPKELIHSMVDQFRQKWHDKLEERAKASNRSVHDIVTVASIVETEAKLPEDRALVASVIYNRLAHGIPLAVDSTIIYASKMAGKWKNDGKVYQSDLDRPSPYNTRKVKGLPPAPVSSPGIPSLEAAIDPASTPYLYYVRNPKRNDGAHNFYTTAADFEVGVIALRAWEAEQKALQKKQNKP